ncbi:hypothetical protein KEJ15_04250 [Candidatus Bathyarchaeota archaeon]|nr:hypothetical protein [Candidatus Bathyarchaeota archaeon]
MKLEKKYALLPLISIVSAILSYFINHDMGQGAVIAASIIGLGAGLLFKEPLYAVASYSAAFMGMCSKAVFPEWYYLILAGLVHALIVIALLKVFVGWGGKAGTMGFIAVNITIILLYLIHPVDYYTGDPVAKITSYPPDLWVAGILAGIAGIMLTILIREKAPGGPKGNDAVIGSAIVALVGGIIAPRLGAAPFSYANASYLAAIIASGSYAGMASRKILPKLYDFLVVGIILGILNLLLWSIFPGFGGKLGTIGLISCAIWMIFIRIRKPSITPPS